LSGGRRGLTGEAGGWVHKQPCYLLAGKPSTTGTLHVLEYDPSVTGDVFPTMLKSPWNWGGGIIVADRCVPLVKL
jgi:hypothetical protein